MFCKNCGTKVSDDTKFCPNCGTLLKKQAQPVQPAQPTQPVQQAMYQNPYGQQPIQQQFAGPVAKKPGFFKSHKKVMIPVAVVAVVAIVGGGVVAYFNTPERRYKRAQTAAIKESAANVAAIYDNYVNTGIDAKNFGTDISGRVDIGDEGKKYIAMANLSGMDFSKLDSAEVNAHVDAQDTVFCGRRGLK
ncbi:MAG: zinc-ribbon domain-containing protein, partial [Lachnospiraceae bacterium]|nr:zinc-ribbon domain-containing protein [Lachnospiraceae bacterium]